MDSTIVGIASIDSKDVPTPNGREATGLLFTIKDALGTEYTTFSRELAQQVVGYKGQNATIEFETVSTTKPNRQGVETTYTNRRLKSIGPVSGAATVQAQPGSQTRTDVPVASAGLTAPLAGTNARKVTVYSNTIPHSSSQDKDSAIARAVALKAAIATGFAHDPGAVLTLADLYLPWLQGQAVAEAPAETTEAFDPNDVPF